MLIRTRTPRTQGKKPSQLQFQNPALQTILPQWHMPLWLPMPVPPSRTQVRGGVQGVPRQLVQGQRTLRQRARELPNRKAKPRENGIGIQEFYEQKRGCEELPRAVQQRE